MKRPHVCRHCLDLFDVNFSNFLSHEAGCMRQMRRDPGPRVTHEGHRCDQCGKLFLLPLEQSAWQEHWDAHDAERRLKLEREQATCQAMDDLRHELITDLQESGFTHEQAAGLLAAMDRYRHEMP